MSPLPGNRVNSEVNVLIREQLSYQSWLLIGAAIQSALVYTVRAPYSLIPLLASLAYIVIPYTLESLRVIPRRSSPPVDKGRLVAQPPTPNTGVTVFVLGFQSAHPLRIMAPGTKEMGEHFAKIFATAEADPNSGLLGRTGTMFDDKGEGGNAMMSISYWTCEEKLKAWHSGPAHSEAMKWYYSTRTKYPHIGEFRSWMACVR